MSAIRYLFYSVVAVCATFLVYKGCSAMATHQDEIEASRERFNSQLHRYSRMDIGDCVPVCLIETDDENRFVVIGDYRKDSFVVMQRFVDGYRVIYPSHEVSGAEMRSTIRKLEDRP